MRFELFLAGKMAYRNRKVQFLPFIRTLAMTGLVLGTVALTLTAGVLRGFENNLIDKITGFDAHIRVVTLLDRLSERDPDFETAMDTASFITSWAPFASGQGILSSADASDGMLMEAMDSAAFSLIHAPSKKWIAGDLQLRPASVLLGQGLAATLNARVGDTVHILRIPETLSLYSRVQKLPLTVNGIFSTGMAEFDKNLCYTDLHTFQQVFQQPGRITGYQIMTRDPADLPSLTLWSESHVAYPFYYMTWKERHYVLFRWLETQKLPITVIFGLIALVAVVNIVSTLYMIVIVKEKEIATLKAIGLSAARVRRIFFWEGLIMSSAGVSIGLLLAKILEWGQMRYGWIRISADVYFVDRIPIQIDADIMLVTALFGILISLAASLYPAARAASVKPFELLRYE